MTDYWKAAIEAAAYRLLWKFESLPHGTRGQVAPYVTETHREWAEDIITDAEPHLRKKWAEDAETLMPEMGSHINVTPYREGVADGINRVLRLLDGAGE